MRLLALAAFLGTALAACTTPEVTPFEPLGSDGSGDSSESNDSSSAKTSASAATAPNKTPARVVTPSTPTTTPTTPTSTPVAPDTVWKGTLATTSTTAFGGPFNGINYCNYATHFENVTVTLTMTGDGAVRSADVRANMVEETVGTCSNTPIPANAHDYAFTPEAPSPTTSFQASGADTDNPHAMMTAQVATTASGHVTLTWHRDDIDAPFDWTLTADVPLTQQ